MSTYLVDVCFVPLVWNPNEEVDTKRCLAGRFASSLNEIHHCKYKKDILLKITLFKIYKNYYDIIFLSECINKSNTIKAL